MIIVPTEKQLDWRHAPIMLCVIVLLNILIFFVYQSGDDKKLHTALDAYSNNEYFEREWPLFQNYLEGHKETALFDQVREEYKKEAYPEVMMTLLMRDDFYEYMKKNARQLFEPSFYDRWDAERERIQKIINSVSHTAYGLRADKLQPFNFISYQFLHGGIMHLLGNMFFLIVCGFAVEAAVGHWRFLVFYLLAGIGGGAAQVLMHMDSSTPLVGASGAISGVMAMYLALFRLKKIEFFYWLFFFVGYFRAPALMILPFYIGKELFSYFEDTDSNVAFMAHTGGFVAGALLIGITWVVNRKLLNTDYIENDQVGDPQQQKMAEIYKAIEQFQFDRALKLADALIAADGESFDLSLIRYNLLRLNRGEVFEKAAAKLLCLPSLMPAELKKLDKIWRDNPEVQGALDEQQLLKLGVQFASHASAESAEAIYQQLLRRGCKDSTMPVFAAKLAKVYQQLNDHAKTTHFERLAKSAGN